MKIIIAGGRNISDYSLVQKAIDLSGFRVTEVVSGCAPGVDTLGRFWAGATGIPVKRFPANWNDLTHTDARIKSNKLGQKYDANAGHRRNTEMAEYADGLILIWDGRSPGSADMKRKAKKVNIPIYEYLVGGR